MTEKPLSNLAQWSLNNLLTRQNEELNQLLKMIKLNDSVGDEFALDLQNMKWVNQSQTVENTTPAE